MRYFVEACNLVMSVGLWFAAIDEPNISLKALTLISVWASLNIINLCRTLTQP